MWVNEPSIHTQPLAEELANTMNVTVVADGPPAVNLRAFGTVPARNSRLIVAPSVEERDALGRELAAADIQVFTGLGVYPGVTRSLRLAARLEPNAFRWVFSESWDDSGLRGRVRAMRYKSRYRTNASMVSGVLATGELAKKQFQHLGFDECRVTPFAYSTTTPVVPTDKQSTEKRLIFVGSFSARKQPDLLLESLAESAGDWAVDLVGAGPLEPALRDHARAHRLNVRFFPTMENSTAVERISRATALVLPSRFDGWGAVVNEALSVGTPAVVSDRVGSSAVIRSPLQGAVFKSGDRHALADALSMVVDRHEAHGMRAKLREWAETSISPRALASYLVACTSAGQRDERMPIAPWGKS